MGAEKGRLFVIVSAMGKTTNALEGLLDTFYDGKTALALERLQNIVDFHNRIIAELWGRPFLPDRVARFYMELEETVASSNPAVREYEVWYDRIVGYGELISTSIVSEYLAAVGIANTWVDMRECFVTTRATRMRMWIWNGRPSGSFHSWRLPIRASMSARDSSGLPRTERLPR